MGIFKNIFGSHSSNCCEDEQSNERKEACADEPVLVALIDDCVLSSIFQDILKNNKIPCMSRQYGVVKRYPGEISGNVNSVHPDYIYVMPEHEQEARNLYEAFIESENTTQND